MHINAIYIIVFFHQSCASSLFPSTCNLPACPNANTHPNSHTLPWGRSFTRLPSLSLSSMLSRDQDMNERPGNLTVSNDRCAEVELRAWPIMLLKIHSLKKKETWEEGGQRYGPTQPTHPPSPHTRDSTNVTSCLCQSRLHCCQ